MPKVLTTKADIRCPHQGVGTSFPTDPKWTINGGIVLLENDMGTLSCPFVPLPCGGYQLKSMGLNATQVDGRKVILDTDFNRTDTGLPLLIQEFHQTIDNSTVAPIPPGQQALPLAPELADIVKPTVAPMPPTLAFDLTTKLPPTLIITFTLFSAYPLKWILTLLNEPDGSASDITNGAPPNLVVAPTGGSWNTPGLVITVSMTITYLASLKPGRYHFFMTAVNHRGLSRGDEAVLLVSP